jgi:predicted DNA-binding transcriptional regulator YafY
LQLVMILQAGRFPNARRLADECAVSRRTIYRDLATLDAAGIPVLYRPDRQGYQLARQEILQLAQLDDQEALAIVLLSRFCRAELGFGLIRYAQAGIDKMIQALPREIRCRVTLGSELIEAESESLQLPRHRHAIYEAIWSALRQRRQMRLWYHEDSDEQLLTTRFSLYRLARIARCWCIVGRSTCHREIRLLRLPWIHRVEVTDEPYTIPPRFRLKRWLNRSSQRADRHTPRDVELRITSGTARLAVDDDFRIDGTPGPPSSGALDLFYAEPPENETVAWILSLGGHVELLKPEPLRRAVRETALRVAHLHAEEAQ